jgi:organic hydroperoxide reductase OsmC/OhrA
VQAEVPVIIGIPAARLVRALRIATAMHPLPHRYTVTAAGDATGEVGMVAPRLAAVPCASPEEFGGPGDRWSPETLLVGAVGDCLILTFRAVAAASRLPWTALRCRVSGTLDRIDRRTQFTAFDVEARREIPAGGDADRARLLLAKAEQNCLIANSLKGRIELQVDVVVAAPLANAV